MAKYTITQLEIKQTSTGKTKAEVTLADTSVGKEIQGVTIWGDWPNFSELKQHDEIEGNLVEKQNGQYLNKTLYPITPKPAGKGNAAIGKAMDKKAENIAVAQDRKEQAIILAATMRDATLLTVEQCKQITKGGETVGFEGMKTIWLEWRKWLTINYGDSKPF